MTLVDLTLAEAMRALRAPLVRNACVLGFVVPLLLIIVFEVSVDTEGPSGLRFPASIARFNEFLPLVGLLVPSIVMAWLVGVEQTADTWKLLLVRRPGRGTFLVAKYLVALAVVLALLFAIAVGWPIAMEIAGGLAGHRGPGQGGVPVEQGLIAILGAIVAAPALLAASLLLATLAPRHGTTVGSFGGFLVSMVALGLDEGSTAPVMPLNPASRIAAWLIDSDAHPDLMAIAPAHAVVVLVLWTVLPLVIAGLVFSRRDIESGAA